MTQPRTGRLTLTRKVGQGFTIGSDVQVTIKVVTGRHVMLEIAAPQDRRILRTELAPFPGAGAEGAATLGRLACEQRTQTPGYDAHA